MFSALASFLSPNQTLDLSITLTADGSMKVIVKPQLVKGANASLAIPLALSATPQELDTHFVSSLMQYGGQRTSLQKQIEVTATIIAEANAMEVSKASKAISKSSSSSATEQSESDEQSGDVTNDTGNGAQHGDVDILDGTPSTPAPNQQQISTSASTNDDLLSVLM